jgi:hypothetical protein
MTGCDFCGKRVKGDNTDAWTGKLPMPSAKLTKDEIEKGIKPRPKYSITTVVACAPCTNKIGDFLVKLAK